MTRNLVQSRQFSELLQRTLNAYHNRAISTQEVIEELIKLAKQLSEADQRGADLGLSNEEIASYDALATNESAVQAMGDAKLRVIATELVTQVRNSVTIDWTLREGAQAKIRVMVKRILNRFGYPPDLQEAAVKEVLAQALCFAPTGPCKPVQLSRSKFSPLAPSKLLRPNRWGSSFCSPRFLRVLFISQQAGHPNHFLPDLIAPNIEIGRRHLALQPANHEFCASCRAAAVSRGEMHSECITRDAETRVGFGFRAKPLSRRDHAAIVVQDGLVNIEGILRLLAVGEGIEFEGEKRSDFAHLDCAALFAAEYIGAGDCDHAVQNERTVDARKRTDRKIVNHRGGLTRLVGLGQKIYEDGEALEVPAKPTLNPMP